MYIQVGAHEWKCVSIPGVDNKMPSVSFPILLTEITNFRQSSYRLVESPLAWSLEKLRGADTLCPHLQPPPPQRNFYNSTTTLNMYYELELQLCEHWELVDNLLLWYNFTHICYWASHVAVVKNLPANAKDTKDLDLINGLGRSPEEGNGNPI